MRPATILTIALALLLSAAKAKADRVPGGARALDGRLDLRAADLTKKDVALDGRWGFVWKELLRPPCPTDTSGMPADTFVTLPASWWGLTLDDTRLPMVGWATYHITLTGLRHTPGLGVSLHDIGSAYRLWADSTVIVQKGSVGRDGWHSAGLLGLDVVPLGTPRDSVRLLLQVSNHAFPPGGILGEIRLGPYRRLHRHSVLRLGALVAVAVGLLTLGLYHVLLFVLRRKERASLWLGAFCLAVGVNGLVASAGSLWCRLSDSLVVHQVLGRIDALSLIASVPLWAAYLRHALPTVGGTARQVRMWSLGASALAVMALVPVPALWPFAYRLCFVLLSGLIVLTLIVVIRAVKLQLPYARLTAVGALAVLSGGLHDAVKAMGAATDLPYMLWPAAFIMLVLQSYMVSRRFVSSYSRAERLSGELTRKNEALQRMGELENQLAERIESETELRVWQQYLSDMLQSVDDPVCAANAAGELIFCNRAFAELADRAAEGLLGTPMASIIAGEWCASCEPSADPLRQGQAAAAKLKVIRSDGSRLQVWANCLTLGGEQECISVLVLRTQRQPRATHSQPPLTLIRELTRNRRRLQSIRNSFASITPELMREHGEALDEQLSRVDTLLGEAVSLAGVDGSATDRTALAAEVMHLAHTCWNDATGTDKIALARKSGLWKVHMNQDGFQRAQTLDRYLDASRFPTHPRWNTVIATAEFVLEHCREPSVTRERLQSRLQRLRLYAKT
ncbi:MAG: hypothetical protein GF331_07360 [Chitinivibrionales bacterium]|nr:hypothetical protein [Chitinivibrionales bacterium]